MSAILLYEYGISAEQVVFLLFNISFLQPVYDGGRIHKRRGAPGPGNFYDWYFIIQSAKCQCQVSGTQFHPEYSRFCGGPISLGNC